MIKFKIILMLVIFGLFIIPANSLEGCNVYDANTDVVTVKCSMDFVQLANELNDSSKISDLGNNEWLLNVTILTVKYTTFSINSNNENISWIKITNNHGMIFRGTAEIDGVKITSWDTINNTIVDFSLKSKYANHRAYISFDRSYGGWIKNSDIGYLGYRNKDDPTTCGISLYKSHDIILSNNKFHNIYYAFYSADTYNILIDNNEYYENYLYAIDPHTNSYNFKITNNNIHNNYKFGVIFSFVTDNFLVENNTIHDNNEGKTISYGIFFSRMATNSTARNNTIYNESVGIIVSQSSDNLIYDNKIYNVDRGIVVKPGKESISINNSIYDNKIKDAKINIEIQNSKGNIFRNNTNSIFGSILVYLYNTDFYSIFWNSTTYPSEQKDLGYNESIYGEVENVYGNLSEEPRKNATIMFTFDDGWNSVYETAYPILKANNQKAVSYVIINRAGKVKNRMNWSVLQQLYNEGWDISSHTISHVDIRNIDDARLNYELNVSQNVLISMGFTRSARFIAYPFGGFDNRVINFTMANGYLAGRISGKRQMLQKINLSNKNDLYQMTAFEIFNNTAIADIENMINETIKQNRTLILQYHNILSDENKLEGSQTNRTNFKIISDYIASRKDDISVITMSEYYDSIKAAKGLSPNVLSR